MASGHQRVLEVMAPHGYRDLRQWARSWLAEHPVAGVDPDDVALAMTELVSNSIRHGSGPVVVELVAARHLLRLNVGDCSEEMPRQPPAGSPPYGGRGLLLIGGLASTWGVRSRPEGGKTVWCEFAGRPRSASPLEATGSRGRSRGPGGAAVVYVVAAIGQRPGPPAPRPFGERGIALAVPEPIGVQHAVPRLVGADGPRLASAGPGSAAG